MWIAGRGVRRARPARDHADAGAAGQLAVGVGRVGGGALVAAVDDPEAVAMLVEAVEQREVGLARHAERELGSVGDEPVRQQLPSGAVMAANPTRDRPRGTRRARRGRRSRAARS